MRRYMWYSIAHKNHYTLFAYFTEIFEYIWVINRRLRRRRQTGRCVDAVVVVVVGPIAISLVVAVGEELGENALYRLRRDVVYVGGPLTTRR